MKTLLVLLALILLWDAAWLLAGLRQTLPWDLRGRLAAGENILLLDVRTPQEFNWFHIPGAINAPFGSTGFDAVLKLHSRPGGPPLKVVVVCMTGHRSPLVAWSLKRAGFGEVSNLTWGMAGWKLTGGESVPGGK
ncbi:MAG: rhodanese-like domain-containing protein [Desulfovibrionaceae bacterium]